MSLAKIDSFTKKLAFVAVVIGLIALILVCVGVGTPKWETSYTITGNGTYAVSSTANFFFTCDYSNGTLNNCTTRSTNLTEYPRYLSTYPWMVDYNSRIQNAAGLCIVAIVFLAGGIVMTIIMAFVSLSLWINVLSPALFFLACLFMLSGMAEGSRYLLYNDYSANLYQAGHLFTMLALFISALAAGRIHFLRMKEEEEEEQKKKQAKKPPPVRK